MKLSRNSSVPVKYILVDFNCSREYTHHAEYLRAFANHFRNMSLDYEVWINRAADSEVQVFLGEHPVLPILNSLDYSFKRNENFLAFLLNKIMNGLVSKANSLAFPFRMKEKFLSLLVRLLTLSAFNKLKLQIQSHKKIVIIFPSTDGLALRFVNQVTEVFSERLAVSMRLIGAETRGVLRVDNSHTFVKELLDGGIDLRIGWEVNSMREKLLESGIRPELLYWSPIPTTSIPHLCSHDLDRITFGFLGSARKNKGFSTIPRIISSLQSLNFRFLVQEANFEWDGYSETLKELRVLNGNVKLLPGAASNQELNQALSECSVLILPYEEGSYRFAGSGIMYQAANLGIPIYCTEGVGFDWDVKNFGIGSTFNGLNELRSLIISFQADNYCQNIENYNLARNRASSEFIRRTQSEN